ncbi:MAG: transcriptional repressor NrdR [Candidatus Omnitrophica bacterium]|nr:transcriptional repressor NrdR [Candidatus Omnitrophota bacterium]
MKCPYCSYLKDRVIDSRSANENRSVRRRRECLKCRRRFTTYESIEETALMVVKRDGRRETFDRNKIVAGLSKACEKRPISSQSVSELVDEVERTLHKNYEKEVGVQAIGEIVMKKLHGLDEVAYVRFASVYRQFKDISEFMGELKEILSKK